MENYVYPYPAPYSNMRSAEGDYPDHGDGFGHYYGSSPLNEDREEKSSSRPKRYKSRQTTLKHTRSRSRTSSKSHSRSRTRSRTRSRSLSRTRSISRSRSASGSRRDLRLRGPSFLDAFRVLYLTPSKHKKSTTKYLTTKKRQDRVLEILKEDRLGSKHWYFYPRSKSTLETVDTVPGTRDNCDQRIKVDGEFLRKYKRSKKVNVDAPIAKLKRWELIFYKKLGFIQVV